MWIQKKLIYLLLSFSVSIAVASNSKTVTVVLDWFPNPNHAPLFVAEQEGFFSKQGLKVKFISPADSGQGEKMVAVGKADIAITYHPALLLHVANRLPLVRVASLIDQPLGCLIVTKPGSIKNIAGKKIGYSGTEIEKVILETMLKNNGLSLNQVKLISIGFNLMPALLSKRVDGFIGGMRNFEVLAIREHSKILQVFYPEDFGFPSYEELILVANKNKISDLKIKKFIIALAKGVKYLKQNPDKSWQHFVKNHPELNSELNKKSWFATIQYFSDDPGKLNKSLYQKFANFIYKEKIISSLPKLNDYAVSN